MKMLSSLGWAAVGIVFAVAFVMYSCVGINKLERFEEALGNAGMQSSQWSVALTDRKNWTRVLEGADGPTPD